MPDDRGRPLDSDVCHCGVLAIDHTIRQMRVCHPAEHLNLPYEESGAPSWQGMGDAHGDLAGAVVVKSAVVETQPVPGLPRLVPALGFTFFGLDGRTTVAKALLVLDVEKMRGLRLLVGEAIDGSLKVARRGR